MPYPVGVKRGPMTRCLRAIMDSIRDHGRPPSVRELTDDLGVKSHSWVVTVLDKLQASGLIERGEAFDPRNLKVPGLLGFTGSVPVLAEGEAGRLLGQFLGEAVSLDQLSTHGKAACRAALAASLEEPGSPDEARMLRRLECLLGQVPPGEVGLISGFRTLVIKYSREG